MTQPGTFVLNGEGNFQLSPVEMASSRESAIHFADFDKIQTGDEAHCHKTITGEDVEAFARLSGDTNPLHMNEGFALRTRFQRRVVHGMLLASYVSALVGVRCPGSGALWSQQNFRWGAPVFIGDRIHLKLRVTHKAVGSRSLAIAVTGVNQDGKVFMEGEGVVTVLDERMHVKEIPLRERLAFVTGGSNLIGAAIASALAQAGTAVAINYFGDVEAAEKLCSTIESQGGRSFAVCADVTDYNSISAGMKQASDKFDRPVDILINNFDRVREPRPFVETSWDEFQFAFNKSLQSTFHCCQAVIPGMKEQKSGRIINIGSTFTRNTPPANWSTLAVSESALHSLTQSLAVELGPHGIRVNMVSAGLMDNEMTAGLTDRVRKVQAMQTPLRRLVTPEDVAAVVSALCSKAGDFITGMDVPVCGGLQM